MHRSQVSVLIILLGVVLLAACTPAKLDYRHVSVARYRYGDGRPQDNVGDATPVAMFWESEAAWRACERDIDTAGDKAATAGDDVRLNQIGTCAAGTYGALRNNTQVEMLAPLERCGTKLVAVRFEAGRGRDGWANYHDVCIEPRYLTTHGVGAIRDGKWVFVVPASGGTSTGERWQQIKAHDTWVACEQHRAATLAQLQSAGKGHAAEQLVRSSRCIQDAALSN